MWRKLKRFVRSAIGRLGARMVRWGLRGQSCGIGASITQGKVIMVLPTAVLMLPPSIAETIGWQLIRHAEAVEAAIAGTKSPEFKDHFAPSKN